MCWSHAATILQEFTRLPSNDSDHPECDSAGGPLPLELVTMGDDELSGTSTMTAVPRNPMSLG
ncbi:unnamed protein product [Mycena citricolor]|uniref:Uncharacterized protein n=1 Tax=Mycena citricolor TaxID=2018698 RepID=A0AAD2JV10_9AGAR|nr:unnamed protein product [Mycena citricolor]